MLYYIYLYRKLNLEYVIHNRLSTVENFGFIKTNLNLPTVRNFSDEAPISSGIFTLVSFLDIASSDLSSKVPW